MGGFKKSSDNVKNMSTENESQAVQIIVRIRPSDTASNSVEAADNCITISNPRNSTERLKYTFNRVFPRQSNQVDLN